MTELKRQRSSKLPDEELRLFVESVVDYAILGLDASGYVSSWNLGAERLKGYTADEIIGEHFSVFYPQGDRERDLPGSLLRRAVEEGHVEHTGWRVRKDGTYFWGDVVITAVRSNGELIGFTKVTRDLTERKLADEREHELLRDLERANELKSEFLANMSHEIRTPLNGILGMLGLLLDTDLNADQREFADTAAASSDALLRIVNDILDFSKVEAGKLEVEFIDFDLTRVITDIGDLFRPGAIAANLDLTVECSDEVPRYVRSDPGRLRQVLTNIVGNALKFTRHGAVTVSTSVIERSGDDAVVKIDVIDTGIGIEPKQLARLFAPFAQADPSTTRQYGGTGLGLTISRQLTELMGGSLAVQSTQGVGSTFSIIVPMTVVDVASVEAQADVSETQEWSEDRGRVLVVDDNPVNQRVTALLAEKLGYRTVVVENGAEAVDAVVNDEFDAVLMDVQMPVLDGYAATEQIRQLRDEKRSIPIIAVTASAMPTERERCYESGMNAYLAKPINRRSLAEVLERILQLGPHADVDIDRVFELRETLGVHFASVVDAYVDSARQRLDEIDEGLREKSASVAAAALHTLRGGSHTLMAPGVVTISSKMEDDVTNDRWLDAIASYPALVAAVDRAIAALRSSVDS